MRALVISGGGSKGAFAGGVADYLIREKMIDYDIFTGSSTGSLLAPLLASGDIDRLKSVYTSVTNSDIFSISPFILRNKNGVIYSRINHFNIVRQFILGKKTFGESKALKQLIKRTFTEDHYKLVLQSKRKVVVSVSNFTRNTVEHKYLRDYNYEDYCEWIWISSNFVPFMSLVVKNGQQYADGGFGNFIPIREAIDAGATELDVIVLTPRYTPTLKDTSKNAFDLLISSLDFMLSQIGKDEEYIGLLESMHHGLKIRYFHTPRELTNNSLLFDPTLMKEWWEEGIEHARMIDER